MTQLSERLRGTTAAVEARGVEPDVTRNAALTQRMFNVPEAAAYTRIAGSTLNKLRLTGGGPRFCKIGRRVLYSIDDLDAWLDACLRMFNEQRRRSADDGSSVKHGPKNNEARCR